MSLVLVAIHLLDKLSGELEERGELLLRGDLEVIVTTDLDHTLSQRFDVLIGGRYVGLLHHAVQLHRSTISQYRCYPLMQVH